jgi:hypothetical protein
MDADEPNNPRKAPRDNADSSMFRPKCWRDHRQRSLDGARFRDPHVFQ